MAKQRINKRSIAAKKRWAKKKKKNEILNHNNLGKIGSILKIRLPDDYIVKEAAPPDTSFEILFDQFRQAIIDATAKIRSMI